LGVVRIDAFRRFGGLILAFSAAFCLVWPFCASAENWQARIYEEGSPQRLVGVDKKSGTFFYFEKKSPLKARFSYPCVTGQLAGDKQQVNDLRTPEGIYFVEYKIASGLDFREYGGIAYTLNYPNPVDRLRGKTGHGIWIHSKGFELVPTKGCVAIGLRDIAEVGPNLLPGTAVVLAWELDRKQAAKNDTAKLLTRQMHDWSAAWAARSKKLFDFYDKDSYSKATENFDAKIKKLLRLFKILNFIKIYNREIHVLEGPGYWVTWTEQFYTASNLSTEGIRRLYWQKGEDNKFRIVGMEWTPRDVGMRADFLQGRLVAENIPNLASDAASEKPIAPRLDMPEMAGDAAVPAPIEAKGMQAALQVPGQAVPARDKTDALSAKPDVLVRESQDEQNPPVVPRASLLEMAKNLLMAISEPLIPKRPAEIEEPAEFIWGKGPSIGNEGRKKETAPEKPVEKVEKPREKIVPAVPDTEKTMDAARIATLNALDSWNRAFAARDRSIEQFYDRKNYNRVLRVPHGFSFGQAMIELRRHYSRPWILVINRPWKITVRDDAVETSCDQLVSSLNGMEQGVRKLWWKDDGNGNMKIVASSFQPRDVGLRAHFLETISGDISAMLEEWRKAWQAGKVDDYISHYTSDAVQQGRQGAQNIRRQKEGLWSRVKPVTVALSGVRLTLDKQGVRADMSQFYKDSVGRSDKGIKTLVLHFDGKKWRIAREDWVANNQQARLAIP